MSGLITDNAKAVKTFAVLDFKLLLYWSSTLPHILNIDPKATVETEIAKMLRAIIKITGYFAEVTFH